MADKGKKKGDDCWVISFLFRFVCFALCVDIGVCGVLFDKLAARFYVISHQHREDFVGFGSVLVTCFNKRVLGSIVVSHNCSGFISPRPLYRCT